MTKKFGYFTKLAVPRGRSPQSSTMFSGGVSVPEGVTVDQFYEYLKEMFEPSGLSITSMKSTSDLEIKSNSLLTLHFANRTNDKWTLTSQPVQDGLVSMRMWTKEELLNWIEMITEEHSQQPVGKSPLLAPTPAKSVGGGPKGADNPLSHWAEVQLGDDGPKVGKYIWRET